MDAELSEINITPFTDVLLVLLVIFMLLAALVVPPGFERELPNCSCLARRPLETPAEITVVVRRSGALLVHGRQISVPALYNSLAAIGRKDPRTKVMLYGDGGAPFQQIMRVLDASKEASLSDVAIVTQ